MLTTEFVGRTMCIIYHRTKFNIPSSNGSLIIVIKPKAKYIFQAESILLFHIP